MMSNYPMFYGRLLKCGDSRLWLTDLKYLTKFSNIIWNIVSGNDIEKIIEDQ
jgi:hypothetical protein